MNQEAYNAIAEAWEITNLVRSLFPSTLNVSALFTEIESPGYYKKQGVGGHVWLFQPITGEKLNKIGKFVNESFVIYMMSILEQFDIVPDMDKKNIIPGRDGADFVELALYYRHRFAHKGSNFDPNNKFHTDTRKLFERLYPELADKTTGFPTSIDTVLPKLADGVLRYIKAST